MIKRMPAGAASPEFFCAWNKLEAADTVECWRDPGWCAIRVACGLRGPRVLMVAITDCFPQGMVNPTGFQQLATWEIWHGEERR